VFISTVLLMLGFVTAIAISAAPTVCLAFFQQLRSILVIPEIPPTFT